MKIYIINIIENLREKCEKSEETPRRQGGFQPRWNKAKPSTPLMNLTIPSCLGDVGDDS